MGKTAEVKKELVGLDVIYPHSAGLDVGSMLMAVSYRDSQGECIVKEYGSFTEDLYLMSKDLAAAGVTHVAMEATGVYWMSAYSVLESWLIAGQPYCR